MDIKDLKIVKEIQINYNDALIIVDMQYDFMPKGALPVEGGDQIIDNIFTVHLRFEQRTRLVWILLNLDECLIKNHKEHKVHKEIHLKNYFNNPS